MKQKCIKRAKEIEVPLPGKSTLIGCHAQNLNDSPIESPVFLLLSAI
jgi:hypothetical protein